MTELNEEPLSEEPFPNVHSESHVLLLVTSWTPTRNTLSGVPCVCMHIDDNIEEEQQKNCGRFVFYKGRKRTE